MSQINYYPHNFYIPVMGTSFTIDTPLAVAKYGISSEISLVDDVLIEQIRKFWCEKLDEPYEAIITQDPDRRAKRITAYLNLLEKAITKQFTRLKTSPFEPNSEITNYYEMLPNNELKQLYQDMLQEEDATKKLALQDQLREAITIGSTDVNIMTKLDGQSNPYTDTENAPTYKFSDAAAALRGFANSDSSSSVVLSAGFNPNLYGYIANFPDFLPDKNGEFKKKICLKVSDFRSAEIQGKYLAKRGIWVSEFRVESPLNCGGHAFINDGHLLGPILEEFKNRKNELIETMHGFYKKAITNIQKFCSDIPKKVLITAQGGIGTNDEHAFLLKHYNLAATGWGTPFLLVPEVTSVDQLQLEKLLNAKADDVFLSSSSPLGVPFWNLRTSASEEARLEKVKNGTPGSVCVKGYAKFSKEFTDEPLCKASREYQHYKLQELENSDLPAEQFAALKEDILSKSCICTDLAAGALLKHGVVSKAAGAICPGPNLIWFKKMMTLKEMVDHIYGRCSKLIEEERPHMFIAELKLQINYLIEEIKKSTLGLPTRSTQKLTEVIGNLNKGIAYYQELAKELLKEQQEKFLLALGELQEELNNIQLVTQEVK
ncbi:MAG: hypothetical protein A2103_05760 [Gammaproteobacteria bacterium GWF2_41_13]|nr:MAG: hypothetical protein A2103_05760 [Gammaproteobacteria bacterium GWF2_41_13]OGT08060.1 MAG: hypothetical protein A2X78_05080 [Gammaproteobacteria bacterium GWE2_37_16]